MTARVLPVALVLAALVADARDLHAVAFYLLVGGVAAAAVSALSFFGELVELAGAASKTARLQVVLSGLALVCVLVAAATRGQGNEVAPAPAPAVSALVAALGVYATQALAALYRPSSGAN